MRIFGRFLIVFFCLIVVSGCSTTWTKKGAFERDMGLTEKELYLNDIKTKGFYNCLEAGIVKSVCAKKFGFKSNVTVHNLKQRVRRITTTTYSGGKVTAQTDVGDFQNSSDFKPPPAGGQRNYCRIGADPEDNNKKMSLGDSLKIPTQDMQVLIGSGSGKKYSCWLRRGDPNHTYVVGPENRPLWVKKCGNTIYRHSSMRQIRQVQVRQEPKIVKRVETIVSETKIPNFQELYRPDFGRPYLDSAPGTWAGNLYQMFDVFDNLPAAAAAGYFYYKGQKARRPNVDNSSIDIKSKGGSANASGGISNSESIAKPVATANGGIGGMGGSANSTANGGNANSTANGGNANTDTNNGPVGGSPSNNNNGGAPVGGSPPYVQPTPVPPSGDPTGGSPPYVQPTPIPPSGGPVGGGA